MIIATLKEVKNNENRVALTPDGVKKLVAAGCSVIVQSTAGLGSGFTDAEYVKAGAKIEKDAETVVRKADMIVKIKEPIKEEYHLLKHMAGKTLFTYLHLSGVDPQLTEKLLEYKVTAIAYETVETVKTAANAAKILKQGKLPLLAPMSQVAGVLACQYGANYMQKKFGGRGVSLGHIDGARSALTVVVGGGFVGRTSMLTAGGMGGKVVLLDINPKVIARAKKEAKERLGSKLSKNVSCVVSNAKTLAEYVKKADLLIGAVLVPGARAPQVVTEAMVKNMLPGAVIVDVSIDQGGCVWGSHCTSHDAPVFDLEGKIFCCIPNMPGQVAHQSTQALTSATIPYMVKMAKGGVVNTLKKDAGLRAGLNTYNGMVTYKSVAKDLGLMDQFVESMVALG